MRLKNKTNDEKKTFTATRMKELLEEFKKLKDQYTEANKKKTNKKEVEEARDKYISNFIIKN